MDRKLVFVHPPFEELEAQFMQCPTFKERHCWISDDRRKALITEFVKKLTPADWAELPFIVGKVSYISDVPADPIKETKLPWREWYRYEVRCRLDAIDDTAYVVLEIEHSFRNKLFGAGLREIWVAVDVLVQAAKQLRDDVGTALAEQSNIDNIKACAFAKPTAGLTLDRPRYWFSDKPFEAVEMWEGDNEPSTR